MAEVLLAEMLKELRADQRAHGETLARIDERTKATADQLVDVAAQAETADRRAVKALALHDDRQRFCLACTGAAEGDPEHAGWWWRATPQALAARWPVRALTIAAVVILLQTALPLALAAIAGGPGGGLKLLLQEAGIRAVYVPTPEPAPSPRPTP